MPEFAYTARELSGKQVAGVLTAGSEKDALSVLQGQGLFPTQIGLSAATKKQAEKGSKRVPGKLLTVFYTQLSDLLRSGVPLIRSLQLLEEQTSHPALKFVTQDIREQVADGTRLNDAMKRHPKAFNNLTISMVKAGEEGGFLEDVLERTAKFSEQQEELKAKVTGASIYPVFLTVAGGSLVSALLIFFVPKFAVMFERMQEDGQLPWPTITLLSVSGWLGQHWIKLFIGIAAAIAGIVYYVNNNKDAQEFIDRWKLKLPGIGAIVQNLAVARFCRILGTLLGNGVPILQSLQIAKDASGNIVLAKAIGNAADNVSGGKSLAEPLRASGQFSKELVEMISIGEEANNLERVLINVSDTLEKTTTRKVDTVVRLLEPILLLAMAAIVSFVIAALLLPIMQMTKMR